MYIYNIYNTSYSSYHCTVYIMGFPNISRRPDPYDIPHWKSSIKTLVAGLAMRITKHENKRDSETVYDVGYMYYLDTKDQRVEFF